MKILILGVDGYLGYSLADYLTERKHRILGLDNFFRRRAVAEVKSQSLIPIEGRKMRWDFIEGDVNDYNLLSATLLAFKPDAIIHFAEQPSAPFSMMDASHALFTQRNNILGTMTLLWAIKHCCPSTHLIKLGTMGVYGTPDDVIPEDDVSYAYDPASFYHNSKAADSINIRKACMWWGLKATDLHQGVVYGHYQGTRFDYDSYFGTVINRFLTQALAGHDLTVYGKGGQTRGFININDTLRCIEIALENPSDGYRVFNQLTELFSINYLAQEVCALTGAKISHIENPRFEKEEHFYSVVHQKLLKLGLKPRLLKDELPHIWKSIQPYKNRVIESVILPKTTWR